MLGLYLSIPFCRAKCSFCNFASGVGSAEAIEQYVGRLCQEIRGARRRAEEIGAELSDTVDTVYFGGGTPSLLEPRQLERIVAAMRSQFTIAANAEITLEAAPGQIGSPLLEAALALGVNRVSLGVQSFVDREAQAVGRSHTEASCRAEFRRLRAAGVANVGADLIAGLPYQTEASWEHSLCVAAESQLAHLSVYMLEVDEDSRLGREVLGGGARLHAPAIPSDDLTVTLYERACERLPEVGYMQYEISNFTAKGTGSRHNLKYWLREPYLGFGLDAHSMLRTEDGAGAMRWANAEELTRYLEPCCSPPPERVSERQAFEETVFLGLRLVAGLPRAKLACFPAAWAGEFDATAGILAREGLMACEGENWLLTRRGQLVSSAVFGELLTPVAA